MHGMQDIPRGDRQPVTPAEKHAGIEVSYTLVS